MVHSDSREEKDVLTATAGEDSESSRDSCTEDDRKQNDTKISDVPADADAQDAQKGVSDGIEEGTDECSNLERDEVTTASQKSKRPYRMKNRNPAAQYFCEPCKRQIKYPSKIKEHLRSHEGARPYACPKCNSSYAQANGLKLHMQRHFVELPFKCTFCAENFKSEEERTQHENNHAADNPEKQPDGCTEMHIDRHDEGFLNINVTNTKSDKPLKMRKQRQRKHTFVPASICISDREDSDDADDADQEKNAECHDNERRADSVQSEERLHEDSISDSDDNIVPQQKDLQQNDVNVMFSQQSSIIFPPQIQNPKQMPIISNIEEEYIMLIEAGNPEAANFIGMQALFENDCSDMFDEENTAMGPEVAFIDSVDGLQDTNIPDSTFDNINFVVSENSNKVKIFCDPRPPRRGKTARSSEYHEQREFKEVVVDAEDLQSMGPLMPKRRPYKKSKPPRHLDFVIDTVARGGNMSLATAHRRRKATIHKCEFCGELLKYPSKILMHMRRHTGERPFTCKICDKRFAQRTPLRMHLRRHFDQRPFVCLVDGCGSRFVAASFLKYHQKTKHTKFPIRFACLNGCGRSFSTARSQRRHHEKCPRIPSPPNHQAPTGEGFVDPNLMQQAPMSYMPYFRNF